MVKALARLVTQIGSNKEDRPLFAWSDGSQKAGEGVRYHDVMKLLRRAATACGRDSSKFGTHSLRKGGACAYLLSGCSYDAVRLFGRWRSDCVRLYIEPAAGALLRDTQLRVCTGHAEEHLLLREPPRPADMRKARLMREARKVQ